MKTDKLINIVKSKRIRMEDLAATMNVSRMQLYRDLAYPQNMKIDRAMKLAEALNRNVPNFVALIASFK